jgi:N-acyl-phosphatidylethanolamine-hydrolysing phospholipase D
MDPEEAVRAALDLRARRVIGMHFGTFDLADEPLDEPPRRFLAEAATRGLEDASVMRVGETRTF